MTSTTGPGEKLALVAGGALVLALVQLWQANRKGSARYDHQRTTLVSTDKVMEMFANTYLLCCYEINPTLEVHLLTRLYYK